MSVQRSDLEEKLREIQSVVDDTAQGAKNVGVIAGVGVAALLLVIYLVGRRRGKKGSARVEVYRLS
ncbi:MAG: hypothetical protein WEE36_09115 [Acidimicrobiia bacterium]